MDREQDLAPTTDPLERRGQQVAQERQEVLGRGTEDLEDRSGQSFERRPAVMESREDQHREELAAEQEQPSRMDAWHAAFSQEQILSHGMTSFGDHELIDPDFRWDEELFKEYVEDVPEHFQGYMMDATSRKDLKRRKAAMDRSLENEETLANFGWNGLGYRLGAALADPVGWGIGSAAGAMFGPGAAAVSGGAYKVRRGQAAFRAAMAGAAGSAGTEAVLVQNKPTGRPADVLYAGLAGAALGGGLGAAFHRNLDPDLREQFSAAHETWARDINQNRLAEAIERGEVELTPLNRQGQPVGPQGVRPQPQDEQPLRPPEEPGPDSPVPLDLEDGARSMGAAEARYQRHYLHPEALDDLNTDASFTAIGGTGKGIAGGRFDVAGQLGLSKNPLVRSLGQAMGQDAVGRQGDSLNIHAQSEWQSRIERSMSTRWHREKERLFRDYKKRHRIGYFKGEQERLQWNREITRKIRDPHRQVDPEVEQAADHMRGLFREYVDLLNNPGVREGRNIEAPRGFGSVPQDPNYVPRMGNFHKMKAWGDRVGHKQLTQAVARAIEDANPHFSRDLSERMAQGWLQGHRKAQHNMNVQTMRGLSGEDLEELREVLRREARIGEDELDEITGSLQARAEEGSRDSGAHPRGKNRVLMNENLPVTVRNSAGEEFTFRPSDLFEEDIELLFQVYNRQASGLAAMARAGIKSDAEWDDLIQRVRATGAEIEGYTPGMMERDIQNLEFLRKGVRGIPTENMANPWTHYARMARDYNFLRVMGQVGWAQLSELGNIAGQEGLVHMFRSMPTFRSMVRDAETGRLQDGVLDELEDMLGTGADIIRDIPMLRQEELSIPADPAALSPALRGVDTAMQYGRKGLSMASGLHPVNVTLHRWAARTVVGQFDKFARKGWHPENMNRRMRWAGLTDDDLSAIYRNIRENTEYERGPLGIGNRPARLNTDRWEPEVREKYLNALDRISRQVIQENDAGNVHRWMGTTLGKLMLQFRSFMSVSYAKQLLQGVNMRDIRATQGFLMSMFFAGSAYTAQTHIRSIGRDDRREYLQERLSNEAIAKASFQRSAWASVLPMLVDSTQVNDPIFDYRSSGMATNAFFGNPVVDLMDTAHAAVTGSGTAAVSDRYQFSQSDARNVFGIMAFQNMTGIEQALNALESKLPRTSER